MKRIKLTLSYEEGVHKELIKRSITIPVPEDKAAEAFDFEGLLASKAAEFSMSIINSNVDIVSWIDGEDVPTSYIAEMHAAVEDGLVVLTCPRLPDDTGTTMLFCPPSMEEFVRTGEFSDMYSDIKDLYESMYWSGHDKEMVVCFKDGKTMRHVCSQP